MMTLPNPNLAMDRKTESPEALSLNAIHIHLLEFDSKPTQHPDEFLIHFLSPDENRDFHFLSLHYAKKEFLFSRILTRHLLSFYTGREMIDLEFILSPSGKPALRSRDLHFNLSHTEGLVALTVSAFPVGIDVELALMESKNRDWRLIADRYFSTEEKEYLEKQPRALRPLVFLRIFTLKEAFLKAMGLGWGGDDGSFTVSFPPEGRIRRGSVELFSQFVLEDRYCLSHATILGEITGPGNENWLASSRKGPSPIYQKFHWDEKKLRETLEFRYSKTPS